MGKKSSALKAKAKELFSPSPPGPARPTKTNTLSPPPSLTGLPPAELAAGEEETEEQRAEREQEEEDLRAFRLEEEERAQVERIRKEEVLKMNGGGEADGGRKKSSKDRFREREERKKAAILAAAPATDEAHDARMIAEKEAERASLSETSKALGLVLHEISPDGHCLYSAVADQLTLLNLIPQTDNHYHTTRNAAASYIQSHADDFLPFLPSVQGEDGAGAENDGMMTLEQLIEYTRLIRETGEWGGEPEILALSKAFNIPIHVIQHGPPAIVVHSPDPNAPGHLPASEARLIEAVRITFHTRMYGLGAHYNSLRPPSAEPRPSGMLDHAITA